MAGKLQKTAKELTDMLWDALKRANAIGFGDYKIRVFPIKVGPSDWDAEITSTQKPPILAGGVLGVFNKAKLELKRQYSLAD
jgi:hypothetical protein